MTTSFEPNNMGAVMDIEKLSKCNLLKEDIQEAG